MSIFKVKQWWSNKNVQSDTVQNGLQNEHCLKADKFSTHYESDCIVLCEGSLIKIYKPNLDENASQILLENDLVDIILHVETGKFIAGVEDRQILVLHPQSYEIYGLDKREGHTDAGDQNLLTPVVKHAFTRKAHSLTIGPFGNIKTRDLICVQSLDGSLSFFDQDSFLFICLFEDVIIPGPVGYVASSDSFVICKSTWILEIYSFQQLREFSEISSRKHKKHTPQWVYNAGEEITGIQVIQTSSNFSTIIAMGERTLCCFQDNGLMKYMLKFDFMPMCFYAYLIGWYYEPGARLLAMVASDDSKLYIYENTTLLWSCDLLHTAISLSRCFLKFLSGGVVALSSDGIVTVNYLGTEPDLNANGVMTNDAANPEQVQAELETVEKSLQKILENNEDIDNLPVIEQILSIKADVGKPVQTLSQDSDELLHLLMCPVVVMITCEEPKMISAIQITYDCRPPFEFSEYTVCIDSVNGTEIVETQAFLMNQADITDTNVTIWITVTDSAGKIVILKRNILLPLSLYCLPNDIIEENSIKLDIITNHSCADYTDIFTDFPKEDLLKSGNCVDTITFIYRNTKKTVTLRSSDNQYSIEANDFTEISSILDLFIVKLNDHYVRKNIKDLTVKFKFGPDFVKQIIHRFLKSIDVHARDRTKLKDSEDELSTLQQQFNLIQKRLLIQYGSQPPGDCEPLEFLMKDTHKRIVKAVYDIIQSKETVNKAGSTLTSVGHLIMCILKRSAFDQFLVQLVEEMLCLNSLYEHHQEWEESVTQSLSYIMNNIFNKSEKDKEKLAPVTEQGVLSHINLKRFLRQIRLVLEKLFSYTYESEKKEKILRIEEFVEII